MSLAKKRTNRIHVQGIDYRWVVSPNDEFLDIVIEQQDVQGQRLAIQLDYELREITPRLVRRLILTSLVNGWTPGKRATQIYWRLMGDELSPIGN